MKVIIISTNAIWSGSEELWYTLANEIVNEVDELSFATFYTNEKTKLLSQKKAIHFSLASRFKNLSRFERLLNKLGVYKKSTDLLDVFLKNKKYNLAIVSQGNNIGSLDVLKLLFSKNISYCTISQLVAEVHQLFIDTDSFLALRKLYIKSSANFFVSKQNLLLHEQMMALPDQNNNHLTYNPYRFKTSEIEFPIKANQFCLAFVGRLEVYHKGLDLLLNILSLDKWQERPLVVRLYGDGPHKVMIQKRIEAYKIKNVIICDYVEDISHVWKENHGLLMPSRMEGQALTLIEACYSKRMTIATNVGDAKDLVVDGITGFLADTASAKAIDAALERAWNRRYDWQFLGEKAYENICKQRGLNVVQDLWQQIQLYVAK